MIVYFVTLCAIMKLTEKETPMNAIQKRRGQYLGTRVEHKWWRRYTKEGFFTRGIGEYWIKDGSLFFQHRNKQKPIALPLRNIVEIKLCPYQRRTQIKGAPIIKLVWEKDGSWLSSGFILSRNPEETSRLLTNLRTMKV